MHNVTTGLISATQHFDIVSGKSTLIRYPHALLYGFNSITFLLLLHKCNFFDKSAKVSSRELANHNSQSPVQQA